MLVGVSLIGVVVSTEVVPLVGTSLIGVHCVAGNPYVTGHLVDDSRECNRNVCVDFNWTDSALLTLKDASML